MWGKGKPKNEVKGEIIESSPELDGRVTVSITVNAVDRQTRQVKIVIVDRQAEDVVFKSEYTTSLKEHLAYESARDIVKAYTKANDYYIDFETTNVEKAVVHTVKRFR
jgi:hypothetical protein